MPQQATPHRPTLLPRVCCRTAFVLTAFVLLADAQPARAQTSVAVGPRVGYEIDAFQNLFIGAEARIRLGAASVLLNPAFDYYPADRGADLFQLSVNGLYLFGANNRIFTPYAGAGVAFMGYTSGGRSTDVGVNLLGGATFEMGNVTPFAQAQITFSDVAPVTLGGGLLFELNRR